MAFIYRSMKSDKPPPKVEDIEELPDAWEQFEKAFDTVMKAKPMPARKAREPSPLRGGKRGATKPA
jgi:hypothetical protein